MAFFRLLLRFGLNPGSCSDKIDLMEKRVLEKHLTKMLEKLFTIEHLSVSDLALN